MADSIHITILVDDSTPKDGVIAEHGLSVWIEYGDKHILFDTGQSDAVIKNADSLGVDLSLTDAIVLSHGHYDHTGGLDGVIGLTNKALIYFHPKVIDAKYSCKDGKSRYIGMSGEDKRRLVEDVSSERIIFTEGRTKIFDGAVVTGAVPRLNGYEDTGGAFYCDENCRTEDFLPDDQSLFFESSKGLVVVAGCAHSGIVNTLDYVATLAKERKVYTIIGGMHLLNSDDERVDKTIEAFKKYKVEKLAPLHCTGKKAVDKIKAIYNENCLLLGAGDSLKF